jgi:hypothetical protein
MLEMREEDGRVGERLDCFGSEREVLNGEVEGDDFVEGDRSVEWSERSELLSETKPSVHHWKRDLMHSWGVCSQDREGKERAERER